jgi:hypothetical protein
VALNCLWSEVGIAYLLNAFLRKASVLSSPFSVLLKPLETSFRHPGEGAATAQEPLSTAEARHDPGTIHLDVQPVGIVVRRVGTPRLDLLDLAGIGGSAGFLGRVGLPDGRPGLAGRTGLPLRGRLSKPAGGRQDQQT